MVCAVFLSVISLSIPSFATNLTSLKNTCVIVDGQPQCDGVINANPGTHVSSGGGGGGYFNGHTAQLNGYMPVPEDLASPCPQPDKNLFSSIGYSRNTKGPFYNHYQVAIDRATQEPIGGAPGTKFWDTSWHLDNYKQPGGVGRADVPEGHNPAANDSWHGWAGAHWSLFGRSLDRNTFCLPLSGGVPVSEALKQAAAKIEFPGLKEPVKNPDGTITNPNLAVGMKTQTVKFEVSQDSVNSAVAINFDFESYDISVIRRFTNTQGEEEVSWTRLNDPVTPLKLFPTKPNSADELSQTFKMRMYKKGQYQIVVRALFTGIVNINGNPLYEVAGLPATSVSESIDVISVKSINRVVKKF